MQKEPWFSDMYWTSPYNYHEEIRKQFTLPERVRIHEVTLREGDQTPHVAFKPDEKIRIATALDELGVYRISIFPIVSKDDEKVTRELTKMGLKAKISCLSRYVTKDIDVALDCNADTVLIEGPGNPWIAKVTWRLDEDRIIENFINAGTYAKEHGLETVMGAWEIDKAPIDFIKRLYISAVKEGHFDTIVIPSRDVLPWVIMWMVRKVKEWLNVSSPPVEMHAHNDWGLATINSLAGVCAGADIVHASINGLGERAGNASLDEVAVLLETLLGVKTGIKLNELYGISKLAEDCSKVKIPGNKPFVGDNMFTIQSGQVTYMMEKMKEAGRPQAYMTPRPELIGGPELTYLLGKMTGRALVDLKLKKMGITVTDEQLERITIDIKKEGMIRKGAVPDYLFKKIVERVTGKK